jgi:hypothetical protein
MMSGHNESLLIAATQNRGQLKLYRGNHPNKIIILNNDDISAVITYKDGRKQKREFYSGASFLSQSEKLIMVTDQMTYADVYMKSGEKRQIKF